MKFRLVAATLATLMVSACSEEAKQRAPEDPIVGHWRSNCVPQSFRTFAAPVKFGITSRSSMKIEADKITEVTYITADGCEGSDVEVTATGPMTKDRHSVFNEVMPINIRFETYRVKPVTEMGMRLMKMREWCGIKDWAIGIERDVTSQVGKELCFPGKDYYTVHMLEGDTLVFGNRDAASEPSSRPSQVVKDLVFSRDYGIFNAPARSEQK